MPRTWRAPSSPVGPRRRAPPATSTSPRPCAAPPAPSRCASPSPSLTSGPVQIFKPASASGTLRWSNGSVQVTNGRAQFDRVRIEGTDAGNVRAAFATAGPGRLRVAPLTARAFGGPWTVNATLARDKIDATVRADGVNLDPILAALDAGPRSDRAGATVDLTLNRPRDSRGDRRRRDPVDARPLPLPGPHRHEPGQRYRDRPRRRPALVGRARRRQRGGRELQRHPRHAGQRQARLRSRSDHLHRAARHRRRRSVAGQRADRPQLAGAHRRERRRHARQSRHGVADARHHPRRRSIPTASISH